MSRLVRGVLLGLLAAAPLHVAAQASPAAEAPEQSAAEAAPTAPAPAQAADAKPAAAELSAVSAPAAAPSAEPTERAAPEDEPELDSRWSVGLRGFGGGLFSKEERVGGGGASALLAFGIVPERWELELGLSVADGPRRPPLGVFELVGKRVFERRGNWAPHLLLGPLFSLDFGDELKPAGGLILGGGVTYWVVPRVGLVADATYRLLIGAEVEHIVALAVGCTFRL